MTAHERVFYRCPDCKHTFQEPGSHALDGAGCTPHPITSMITCPGCGERHSGMFYIKLWGTTADNACKTEHCLCRVGPRIFLRDAYSWDCEECGCENFVSATTNPTLSEEELRELSEEHGVLPLDAEKLVEMPAEVTCRYCRKKFRTQAFNT